MPYTLSFGDDMENDDDIISSSSAAALKARYMNIFIDFRDNVKHMRVVCSSFKMDVENTMVSETHPGLGYIYGGNPVLGTGQ